ncbi:MAG: arginine--tRNA ligase [Opitutales bacterium]|nr:arginine--tRNA ligase [Opitutales bacterium]
MDIQFNPAVTLDRLLSAAAAEVEGLGADFDAQLRPADPRFGDYQANGVLPWAKRQGVNPRQLATALLDALNARNPDLGDWVETSIAGPGFINFKLLPAFQLAWLKQYRDQASLRAGAAGKLSGRKVVVDFSSPNTAKEMHVGHIRSTVIGEAISRLLEFSGAEVIRDNHIGDWGTQFGMLIWAIKDSGCDLDNPGPNALAELEALYKKGNARYKESPEAADQIRAELVKLQRGDPESDRIWKRITEISWQAFQVIYDALDIQFDLVLGESHYRKQVDGIYQDLTETGLAQEDQGALVVFHPEHKRFAKQPFIVRKADGASNYASTDLATVRYRTDELKADEVIYVVDSRQSDHFEQLFLTVAKYYAAKGWKAPSMQHVSFGTVLGENGKPIKTKEGGSVKLKDLMQEAIERSFAVVTEKNPDLPEDERRKIAEAVGLGAIRYIDLSQNRTSDYIFSWERMLSFEGNTAPYLLYAVARIHSILRKAGIQPDQLDELPQGAELESDGEKELARKLVLFPATLDQTLSDLRPHFLGGYLFELAGVFSSFYTANKVLVDDPAVRDRRLMLCQRTLRVLECGLHLLGLKTLERM